MVVREKDPTNGILHVFPINLSMNASIEFVPYMQRQTDVWFQSLVALFSFRPFVAATVRTEFQIKNQRSVSLMNKKKDLCCLGGHVARLDFAPGSNEFQAVNKHDSANSARSSGVLGALPLLPSVPLDNAM
ncbi:hypothetical protein CBL_01986 [Carabus blaptoides fortunei]